MSGAYTQRAVWIITQGDRPPRAFRTKTRAVVFGVAALKKGRKWPTLWRQELEHGDYQYDPELLGYWMPLLMGWRWDPHRVRMVQDGVEAEDYRQPVFIPAHEGKRSMQGDIWMFYRIGELRKDP